MFILIQSFLLCWCTIGSSNSLHSGPCRFFQSPSVCNGDPIIFRSLQRSSSLGSGCSSQGLFQSCPKEPAGIFAVCFRSLFLWKVNPWSSLRSGEPWAMLSRMFLDIAAFIFPSSLTHLPAAAAGRHCAAATTRLHPKDDAGLVVGDLCFNLLCKTWVDWPKNTQQIVTLGW